MKNKKALTTEFLVGITVSILTFILISYFIIGWFENYKYESTLTTCNQLFENIDGKKTYFSEDQSSPNFFLLNSIKKFCAMKTVEEKKRNVMQPSLDLIEDCWFQTGEGVNIFASNSEGETLCMVCGIIQTKEDISDYGEKLKSSLSGGRYENIYSDEIESDNLNNIFLKDFIPESLSSDEVILVTYMTYIPQNTLNLDPNNSFIEDLVATGEYSLEEAKQLASKSIGEVLDSIVNSDSWESVRLSANLLSFLQEKFETNPRTPVTGIVLNKIKVDREAAANGEFDFAQDNSLKVEYSGGSLINCGNYLVVPQNSFD